MNDSKLAQEVESVNEAIKILLMDYDKFEVKNSKSANLICVGCVLMQLVSSGLLVNAFSVSQPYILQLGNFTNAQTSMISTIRGITYLVALIFTGFYYNKLDYRLGMTVSALMGAVAFFAFAFSRSLSSYYISGAVAGFSYGFGSIVPATVLITRWFRKNQGLAIGIAAASTGLGALVFAPVVRWSIETFSLQASFIAQAVFSLILSVCIWFLIRNDSPDYGETDNSGTRGAEPSLRENVFTEEQMGKGLRALILVSLVFIGGVSSPGFTHLMILYATSGFDTAKISLGLSLLGLGMIFGKLFFGSLYDRIGAFICNFIFFGILAVSLIFCSLADLGNYALMFASLIMFGVGIPVSTVGFSVWAKDFSSSETLPDEVKKFQICFGIGNLVFSVMPGAVADITGSYAPAYAVFLVMELFSFTIIQLAYCVRSKKEGE